MEVQQLQRSVNDGKLQLIAVELDAEKLSKQVTELQTAAQGSQFLLHNEQQNSRTAAQRSFDLEQQLQSTQASLEELTKQLDDKEESETDQVQALQGKT